eukprot:Nitzschia sp. Nitz4//scaffold1_size375055//211036//211796//NITZ4_000284-RA/size375055-augustus-gene-0.718-mRNA-1//-1//CDS//3329541069//1535//frame0
MKHLVADSYFDVVSDVNTTWTKIKSMPDYRKVMGVELFSRMFEISHDVWRHFPFGKSVRPGSELADNEEFVAHATNFMAMLDMAIDMLGPDLDLAEEQLQSLGVRHIGYGVMPKHYPLMGRALIGSVKKYYGEMTPRQEESWNAIYTFMSVSMMQGAFQELLVIRKDYRKVKARLTKLEEKPQRRGSNSSAASGSSIDSGEFGERLHAPKPTPKLANFFRIGK